MKLLILASAFAVTAVFVSLAQAQSPAWRCGTEYTNDAASARRTGCRLLAGKPAPPPSVRYMRAAPNEVRSPSMPAPASRHPRVESAEQHKRDGEARFILLAELRKAEARQAELLRDHKPPGGAMPEEMARNESDIAAIRREIGRLPVAPQALTHKGNSGAASP